MLLKISKIVQVDGNMDYKTLDISNIVSGTQLYDFTNNVAYVEYNETLTPHSDLVEITQVEYDNAKAALTTKQEISLKDRVTELESVMNTFLLGGI